MWLDTRPNTPKYRSVLVQRTVFQRTRLGTHSSSVTSGDNVISLENHFPWGSTYKVDYILMSIPY